MKMHREILRAGLGNLSDTAYDEGEDGVQAP